MKKKGKSTVVSTAVIVVAAVMVVTGWSLHSIPGYKVEPGNHVVEKAFYERQSDLMVEVSGEIFRLIGNPEENQGMQWFQMRTPEGQYLMVGHENGMSKPIPLATKQFVTVRGNYEWTESGGTIRGTQKDNSLARRHGWIEYQGKKYQ